MEKWVLVSQMAVLRFNGESFPAVVLEIIGLLAVDLIAMFPQLYRHAVGF
ncbi:hypothetical protein [Exiguobacterium sp. S3]|nr:hypothetical protein [Exiguobacterium sp. S3]